MAGAVPDLKWGQPSLNHKKQAPYIDFPIVYNSTVTNEAFYAEYPFTIVTSVPADTTLSKWNGNGWTAVTGIGNPEYIFGRGFFAVTTTSDVYVAITEHVHGALYEG